MDENTRYLMERFDSRFDRLESKLDLKFNEVTNEFKEKQDKNYCKENCTNISIKKLSGSIGGIMLLIIGLYEGLQQAGLF